MIIPARAFPFPSSHLESFTLADTAAGVELGLLFYRGGTFLSTAVEFAQVAGVRRRDEADCTEEQRAGREWIGEVIDSEWADSDERHFVFYADGVGTVEFRAGALSTRPISLHGRATEEHWPASPLVSVRA